jgi:lactoylglutathione lyase
MDASVRFYETLGFTCTRRHRINEHLVEATLENPARGGWLQLAQDSRIRTPIDLGSAVFKIYVYTDDCRAAYERALKAGYRSREAPRPLERWPYQVAFFEDPDGYLVELVENNGPADGRDSGGS